MKRPLHTLGVPCSQEPGARSQEPQMEAHGAASDPCPISGTLHTVCPNQPPHPTASCKTLHKAPHIHIHMHTHTHTHTCTHTLHTTHPHAHTHTFTTSEFTQK